MIKNRKYVAALMRTFWHAPTFTAQRLTTTVIALLRYHGFTGPCRNPIFRKIISGSSVCCRARYVFFNYHHYYVQDARVVATKQPDRSTRHAMGRCYQAPRQLKLTQLGGRCAGGYPHVSRCQESFGYPSPLNILVITNAFVVKSSHP